MKIHDTFSHLDHHLSPEQIAFIKAQFFKRSSFFNATIELPANLGTVPCGLWGPLMGDPAIENGTEILPLKPGEYIVPPGRMVMRIQQGDVGHQRVVWDAKPFTGAITLAPRSKARTWPSRLIDAPTRPTRLVTVIAGPHPEVIDDIILYTAYGGPSAPREPGDPSIADESALLSESVAFWTKHALSRYA